jgi:hypothetical protein
MCFMEQELQSCLQPDATQKEGLDRMMKDMQALLARLG